MQFLPQFLPADLDGLRIESVHFPADTTVLVMHAHCRVVFFSLEYLKILSFFSRLFKFIMSLLPIL